MQTHYWGCRVQSPHDVWTQYELGKPLANAEGGEGGIFALNTRGGEPRVAKLYNPKSKALLTPHAFESLAHLTNAADTYAETLPFVAWPLEVLFTIQHPAPIQHLHALAGITMRQVSGHKTLERITTYGKGRFGIGTENALRIASLIANYLGRLHKNGIVFCDFNPKNVLVSNDHTRVTFVDADAFQHSIIDNVFTKPHYAEGYASLQHVSGKPGPRQPEDDNFVLAIHIFQLLTDGGHPFDTGPAYNPTGDPFSEIKPHDNIKARRWPYSDVAKYFPPGETPKHYARLHPELRAMFERAFQHSAPPLPEEWEALLPKFRTSVETESSRPQPHKPAASQQPTPLQTAKPAPTAASTYRRTRQPTARHTSSTPANYSYHTAAGLPGPAPEPPRPPTAKSIAKAAAWWLAKTLWRILATLTLWTLKQLRAIAVDGAETFRKSRGAEFVAAILFFAAIFWAYTLFEAQHAANTQNAAKPGLTPTIGRPVKTFTTPPPPGFAQTPPPPAAPKRQPPKPDPEPEVLPWLAKQAPQKEPIFSAEDLGLIYGTGR
jgi:hypothetical protein